MNSSIIHKNLRIIDGFDKHFAPKIINRADFVFKIITEMAHTVGYKAEKEISQKPYCELTVRNNTDIMMGAMANVLCRHLNLKK